MWQLGQSRRFGRGLALVGLILNSPFAAPQQAAASCQSTLCPSSSAGAINRPRLPCWLERGVTVGRRSNPAKINNSGSASMTWCSIGVGSRLDADPQRNCLRAEERQTRPNFASAGRSPSRCRLAMAGPWCAAQLARPEPQSGGRPRNSVDSSYSEAAEWSDSGYPCRCVLMKD